MDGSISTQTRPAQICKPQTCLGLSTRSNQLNWVRAIRLEPQRQFSSLSPKAVRRQYSLSPSSSSPPSMDWIDWLWTPKAVRSVQIPFHSSVPNPDEGKVRTSTSNLYVRLFVLIPLLLLLCYPIKSLSILFWVFLQTHRVRCFQGVFRILGCVAIVTSNLHQMPTLKYFTLQLFFFFS